ncbi:hypothetical protein [Pengzhenrongella sp.]|uniref:hypothetical protein n=1 Tax=Pengzhenrongella sp. TaxID=2888820 RepID=UPI002F951182
MKRLFWIGIGAVATVIVIRKSSALIEAHTPPGVARAAGIVGGLGGALRHARSEFSAGLAEREAELRHDLLGDVDLDEARKRTDEWRAQRAGSSGPGHRSPSGTERRRHRGAEPQDDDDGELGYSFY